VRRLRDRNALDGYEQAILCGKQRQCGASEIATGEGLLWPC